MKKYLQLILIILFFLSFPITGYTYSLGEYDINYFGGMNYGIDTNITSTNIDKKNDSLLNLNTAIDLQAIQKLQIISIKTTLAHQIFFKHSEFNNTSENIDFTLIKELSKYSQVSIENKFAHTYDPISFEDSFGKQESHDSHYQNHLRATYLKEITKQLAYNVYYFNEYDSVKNEVSDDSMFNELIFTGHYSIDSANIVLVSYGMGHRRFDSGDSATATNVNSGIRKYISDNLYYELLGGLDFISPYQGENSFKPLFIASLTKETRKTNTLRLEFAKRQLLKSTTKDVLNSWKISLIASVPISGKFSSNLTVFYGNGDFITQHINEKLAGLNVKFNYIIREKLTVSLIYYYAKVTSDIQSREYSRNKLFLNFLMEL